MELLLGLLGFGFLAIVFACGSLVIGAILAVANAISKKVLHKEFL